MAGPRAPDDDALAARGESPVRAASIPDRDGSVAAGGGAHAVAAIKAGAADYVPKPFEPEQLALAVTQALVLARLTRENSALRGEVAEFRSQRQLIGDSPQMLRLRQTIAAAAPTRATVLSPARSTSRATGGRSRSSS